MTGPDGAGGAAATEPLSPTTTAAHELPVELVDLPPVADAGTAPTVLSTASTATAATGAATAEAAEQVRPAVAELARGLRDAGGGRASLVVRLDPPELGPVLVRLTVQDGRVDVQLRASEAVAASGLSLSSADVRSMLAEHGLDLSSFDVRHDDQAAAWAGAQPEQRRPSSDQGIAGEGSDAESTGSADGAGALAGTTTDRTADGSPAGTWL